MAIYEIVSNPHWRTGGSKAHMVPWHADNAPDTYCGLCNSRLHHPVQVGHGDGFCISCAKKLARELVHAISGAEQEDTVSPLMAAWKVLPLSVRKHVPYDPLLYEPQVKETKGEQDAAPIAQQLLLMTKSFATSSHLGKVEKEIKERLKHMEQLLSNISDQTHHDFKGVDGRLDGIKVELARKPTTEQARAHHDQVIKVIDARLGRIEKHLGGHGDNEDANTVFGYLTHTMHRLDAVVDLLLPLKEWARNDRKKRVGANAGVPPRDALLSRLVRRMEALEGRARTGEPTGRTIKNGGVEIADGEQLELVCQGTTTVKVTR